MNLTPSVTSLEFSLENWQGFGEVAFFRIQGQLKVSIDFIEIDTEVIAMDHYQWRDSERFKKISYKNWELWEQDVVEIFIQDRSESQDNQASYYEFMVSPNNHSFLLQTIKPRQINWTPMYIELQTQSQVETMKWKSSVKIQNPFNSSKLWGNIHACLGEKRQFYSLFHEDNDKPDFHRPWQFQKLGWLS